MFVEIIASGPRRFFYSYDIEQGSLKRVVLQGASSKSVSY
jgi:hypothetical protein